MNHPLITQVAWRLMPTVILCSFFASFDRRTLGLATSPLQGALTLNDPAYGLGASLALLLGAGAVLFLLPRGLRAQEGSA